MAMPNDRAYSTDYLLSHPIARDREADDELIRLAAEAGWPDGLLARLLAVRPDRGALVDWLRTGFPTAEMLDGWADQQQELMAGSLRARQATWADEDMLVELCADAPETVGGWTVTVERGPNPYAQYRLQERPNLTILEDHRIALGVAAHSVRNTYIGGERTSVHHMSGWRIRNGFRGIGLSRLLQQTAGPGASWFGLVTYFYVRDGNAATTWIDKVEDDMADRPTGFGLDADRLTASVMHLDPRFGRRSDRVRAAVDADLDACRALINRTHDGLDLFRPYSDEYFDSRLSDPSWGPKPDFYPKVYGMPDYHVVEHDGRVVACGGLWDRGRDLREVWRRDGADGSEHHVSDPTALMDFGYAEGHGDAMAELIADLLARSGDLGRSGLLAPLEHAPDAAEACADLGPTIETRELHVMPFSSPDLTVDLVVTRPYTDLAYW